MACPEYQWHYKLTNPTSRFEVTSPPTRQNCWCIMFAALSMLIHLTDRRLCAGDLLLGATPQQMSNSNHDHYQQQ